MRMKEAIIILLVVIVLTLEASCSFQKGKATGESAVDKFHNQFNSEQYHEIYGQTDEGFRKVTSEQELTEVLKAVHRKLGVVREAKQMAWHVNATTAGTQVYLAYKTSFAEGEATEQFIFFVSGNNSSLFKYNIESPVLITK